MFSDFRSHATLYRIFVFSIFISVFLVYLLIYQDPRNWYNHYFFLAESFLSGKISVSGMPEFYHDAVTVGTQVFLPFPPLPAVVLMPFLVISRSITQQFVSVLIGAASFLLLNYLLSFFANKSKALLLSVAFSLGTVQFWSSVVGTTWYFAHTVALFFLLLSLISHKKGYPLIAGIFLSFASLSRLPVFLGSLFFLLDTKTYKNRVKFIIGASLAIVVMLLYNQVRFGSPLLSGYQDVHSRYVESGIAYNFMLAQNPDFPHLNHLDPRSIPYHLYTFLFFPPDSSAGQVTPSPYGMGILFTSPFLLLGLIPRIKDPTQRNAFLGMSAIATVVFMHYAQGWVQFGYRFVLDFIPFIFIIIAQKDIPKRILVPLVVISVLVTTWGVSIALKLGW